MRRLLIGLIALIPHFFAAQQNFERAIHTDYNYAETDLIQHQGNLYFASVKLWNTSSPPTFDIYSYTPSGSLRFKKSFGYGEGLKAVKLFVTPDGKIATVAYSYQCDVSGQEVPFIIKLDTNGQVLVSKSFTTTPLKGSRIIDACQLANGEFFLASSNKLFKLNSSYNYTTTIGAFDSIFCITSVNNSTEILLNGTSPFFGQGLSCFTFSNNPFFSTIKSYTTQVRCTKIMQNKGSYFGLTPGELVYRLDTAFQTVSNTSLIQNFTSGNRTRNFNLLNDTLYFVGNNIYTPLTYYSRCDTNLSGISYTSNTSPLLTPIGIAADNNNAFILNNNPGSTGKIPHISIISFPKNSFYSYNNDVKLTSVKIDSSYSINTYTYNFYSYVDLAFKATIKNVGNTVINSFYLSADIGTPNGPCYPRLLHKLYQNLTLLPGDSVTVSTSSLTNIPQTYIFPYSTSLSNMCFIVTAPNNKVDKNAVDNILCPNITLTPNSIGENIQNVNPINIFPNPASEFIYVNGQNISSIYIYNNLGQLCYSNKNQEKINIEHFTPGLYFVIVLNSNGSKQTSKLIIQR